MREIKRVTYSAVNSMAVIDGNFQKMIVRKPKKTVQGNNKEFL